MPSPQFKIHYILIIAHSSSKYPGWRSERTFPGSKIWMLEKAHRLIHLRRNPFASKPLDVIDAATTFQVYHHVAVLKGMEVVCHRNDGKPPKLLRSCSKVVSQDI